METTVRIDVDFLLKATNLELTKADEMIRELNRLTAIGYRNSQVGLDAADSAMNHLTKAYELIARINDPLVEPLKRQIAMAIGRQEYIVWSIKLSL